VRLFIHPTRDCNLGCKGCYLTDIPGVEELIQTELPLETFENILETASIAGFDELALLVNPQKKIDKHMTLAESAKELSMTVNMTTTHHVILGLTSAQLKHVDLLSVSVDTEHFKNTEQAIRHVTKVREHLNDINWEGHFNINLTYVREVFDWVKDKSFIDQLYALSDTISHLMMKPIASYYGSIERFEELFQEAFALEHLDITGTKGTKDIGETCVYHMTGLQPCYAGYEELSLDPNGQLSSCVFGNHSTDVSTPEKFESFLEHWFEIRAPVSHCALVQ